MPEGTSSLVNLFQTSWHCKRTPLLLVPVRAVACNVGMLTQVPIGFENMYVARIALPSINIHNIDDFSPSRDIDHHRQNPVSVPNSHVLVHDLVKVN